MTLNDHAEVEESAMNTARNDTLRLGSLNTSGCNMEIWDTDSCNIALLYSAIRGADAPPVHHTRLADSGPHKGLLSLPRAANATFAKGEFYD